MSKSQATGSVIGVNFRWLGGGWDPHDTILLNPNGIFTAGYVRPGGDNWNEIWQPAASSVHNDLVELVSGVATTADMTIGTINFSWGTWYNNVSSYDPGGGTIDNGLTDE